MAITILSPVERDRMRRAGRAAAATLAYVGARLAPGMTTAEIDRNDRALSGLNQGQSLVRCPDGALGKPAA